MSAQTTGIDFKAVLVEAAEADNRQPVCGVKRVQFTDLPQADVTIKVDFSSLNYKDAMAAKGHRGVVKQLPHVPGIDAAGVVVKCESGVYQAGQQVIVTGYDLGQGSWGGWAEYIRVPSEWVVPLPESLTLREAMILGTAGFTAAQCVWALSRNEVSPADGEIVVTGASGGVGSLSVQILAKLGFDVVAVTGKDSEHETLLGLGAQRVVERESVMPPNDRPMQSAKWAGAIDTVGGATLASLLASTKYGGCVACCGLVAGADLNTTLYPFLLRGVTLSGVASADCPYKHRTKIWSLLAGEWKPPFLGDNVTNSSLEQLPNHVDKILAGKVAGRVVVDMSV